MGFKEISRNTDFKDKINQIKKNTDRLRKSPAQRLQDKAHIYCDFYNVNLDHSTVHPGTEDIKNNIGDDSPLRFDKIKDCLMFGLEDWETRKEDDDFKGFTIDRENESVIPADTFTPIENSFFKLELDNKVLLYKVTHVERTMMENIPMYRIEYRAEMSDENKNFGKIEYQVINEFSMLHENIGTDKKVIIQDDEIEDLENLKIFIEKLNHLLFNQYFDTTSKTYILHQGNEIYYSPYVIEFLRTSKTLYHPKFENKIMLSHESTKSKDFDYDFQTSFYIKVLDNIQPNEDDYKFNKFRLPSTSFIWALTSLSFYVEEDLYVIDKNKETLLLEDLLELEENKFELKNIKETDDTINNFLDTYIEKNEIKWEDLDLKYIFENKSKDYYFKLPLVLFICRHHYNNKIGKSLVGYNDMFNQKLL